VTAVEPLGKAAFELFDKDREVIHPLAIGFQQPQGAVPPMNDGPLAASGVIEWRRAFEDTLRGKHRNPEDIALVFIKNAVNMNNARI
jgi:hypothetical protein